MTPASIARLSPARNAISRSRSSCSRSSSCSWSCSGRSCTCTGTTTIAIADLTDRLERYRRVAAQAPELRQALEVMKEKDGRRFYPQEHGAQPRQRRARRSRAQPRSRTTAAASRRARIPAPRDEGSFRQLIGERAVLRDDARAREDPVRARDQQCRYLVVDNMSIRPLNAFRGFKPAPGRNRRTTCSSTSPRSPTRGAARRRAFEMNGGHR